MTTTEFHRKHGDFPNSKLVFDSQQAMSQSVSPVSFPRCPAAQFLAFRSESGPELWQSPAAASNDVPPVPRVSSSN